MSLPNAEDDDKKLFVGGLSLDTTEEGLKAYFQKFGEVVSATVMTDPMTKKPRGFGFVNFETANAVDIVVSSNPHFLDGKTIDPKPAAPRQNKPDASQGEDTPKAFIGGLAWDTTEEDVRAYFSTYGKVEAVDLLSDKETKRLRGFGFVTFADPETVKTVVETQYHQINGKTVEVKRAQPRDPESASSTSMGRGGLNMGRGGYPSGLQTGFGGPYGPQMGLSGYPGGSSYGPHMGAGAYAGGPYGPQMGPRFPTGGPPYGPPGMRPNPNEGGDYSHGGGYAGYGPPPGN